ncbi:MAG: hypothetical protein AAF764_03260 [Pseudomonadota bacterium]
MTPHLLWLPYGFNLLILVPVVWAMLAGSGVTGVFEDKVSESQGLRLLVGSLWLAIAVASVGGFFAPRFFLPVLIIQVIYKACWLLIFILPLARAQGWEAIPQGITFVFIGIVLSYPFFIAKALA